MIEDLNHPFLFGVSMLLFLWGLAAVLTHGAKQLNLSGPASFFQHP